MKMYRDIKRGKSADLENARVLMSKLILAVTGDDTQVKFYERKLKSLMNMRVFSVHLSHPLVKCKTKPIKVAAVDEAGAISLVRFICSSLPSEWKYTATPEGSEWEQRMNGGVGNYPATSPSPNGWAR